MDTKTNTPESEPRRVVSVGKPLSALDRLALTVAGGEPAAAPGTHLGASIRELVEEILQQVKTFGLLNRCQGTYKFRTTVKLSDAEIREHIDAQENEIVAALARGVIDQRALIELRQKHAVAERVIEELGRETYYQQELEAAERARVAALKAEGGDHDDD